MELHEKRRCKCTEHRGDEAWHGRSSGYYHHFCRCDGCRDYPRAWARANPEKSRAVKRKWARANPEKSRAVQREWRLASPVAIKAGRRRRGEVNAQIDAKATRRWAAWTRAEDLMAMRSDLRAMDVALLLGRTVGAVEIRRHNLRDAR